MGHESQLDLAARWQFAAETGAGFYQKVLRKALAHTGQDSAAV
jgi:hypothetical protein